MDKVTLESGQEIALIDLIQICKSKDGRLALEYWTDVLNGKTKLVPITEADMFRLKAAAIKSDEVDVDTTKNMRERLRKFAEETE